MLLIPENIDFNSDKKVAELIADIYHTADNQREFSNGLTKIRNIAISMDKRSECNAIFKRLSDGKFIENYEMRYDYDYIDYSETDIPYWDVFNQPSQLQKDQRLEVLALAARDIGYKSFKKTYKSFLINLRKINVQIEGTAMQNPTRFPDQPIELDAGEWRCDDSGVFRESANSTEIACRHPVTITKRFVNIDTGEEKLKIEYHNGKYWRELIIGKKDAFDASKIIQLAAYGVSVTTSTAKYLSTFLCELEAINRQLIPETESVTRLGYVGDGKRFSPYVEELTFDGDINYSTIYEAISSRGDFEKWRSIVVENIKDNISAKIVLAASFASILVSKIGALPFFVHLWGVDSGTGKTVALMLAASVWGNPEVGQYVQTFNSTQVGLEKTAAFLNNIPLCIDELQLSKDAHGKSKFDVYQLAQGTGRTRGTKSGGVDRTPTWKLCILTTGESPLTSESAGAGAVNRVIDIECKASEKVIKDGYLTSSIIKQNYGHAGKKFVEALTDKEFINAKDRFLELTKIFNDTKATEKQAMAAAAIVLGSELADKYVLKTGQPLKVEDVSIFLKEKSEVSAGQRAYNFLCDWVAVNGNRFQTSDNNGEFWGKIDEDENCVYIISSVFRKVLIDNGYDEKAITSWLRVNNKIRPYNDGKNTHPLSIEGHKARYIIMTLQTNFNADEYELL